MLKTHILPNGRQVEEYENRDYFHGVKPSDLAQLSDRDLYMASQRLYDVLADETGSIKERSNATDALESIYAERKRRASIH